MKKILNYINILLRIFLIFYIILFAINSNISLANNQVNIFCLIIIALSIMIEIIYNIRKKILKLNVKCYLLAIICSLIFLMMLPISNCLNSSLLINLSIIIKTIFVLSLIYSCMYIFLALLEYNSIKKEDCVKTGKIILLLVFVISLLFVFTTTTGYFDYDYETIWELLQNKWQMSGIYPPAFWLLSYLCKILFNNPFPIIVLNFLLFVYFCNYSIKLLERETSNKKILILFFLILLFQIVPFDQVRYLNKDTIFSLSFSILILSIYDYLFQNKMTLKIKINLLIFSTMVLIFRYGTSYFLIFFFLIFGIMTIKKRQYKNFKFLGFNIIVILLVHIIINYISYDILNMKPYDKNYAYTIPIYQIAAFANDGYEFRSEDRQYLQNNFYLPIEYMKDNFIKGDGDVLTRFWRLEQTYSEKINDFSYTGLIKINFHLFQDKPIFYINHFFDLSEVLWNISGNESELSECYLDGRTNDDNIKLTFLNKPVNSFINIFLKSFLFKIRIRGGLSIFIIILSLAIIYYKKRYNLLIPFILIFVWCLLLIISMPMPNTRYCLPFINIYPFIFCLSLGVEREFKEKIGGKE